MTQQNPMPLKSFKALASVINAQAVEQQREDVRRAQNLRKSASIARKAKGTGPRIAR